MRRDPLVAPPPPRGRRRGPTNRCLPARPDDREADRDRHGPRGRGAPLAGDMATARASWSVPASCDSSGRTSSSVVARSLDRWWAAPARPARSATADSSAAGRYGRPRRCPSISSCCSEAPVALRRREIRPRVRPGAEAGHQLEPVGQGAAPRSHRWLPVHAGITESERIRRRAEAGVQGVQLELGGLKELRRRGRQAAGVRAEASTGTATPPPTRRRVYYGPIASRAALVHRLGLQRTVRKNARSLGAIRSRNRLPLKVP